MARDDRLTRLEIRDDIALVTLDNPPVNIMTGAMMDEITASLEKARQDAALKGVAFAAEGKAFCAGADVGEHRPEQVEGMIASFGRMFEAFDALEIPVVMAVDGAVMGGGLELVMMADVLLATERATFGQPEIRLGFFAPVGVVELPRLVGRARAMEITCLGRAYTAAEMRDWGFVSRILPDREGLDAALESVLKDLRKASPHVLRLNTRTLKRLQGRPFREALAESNDVFLRELMTSEDPVEGIASFYEKRKPVWKNR
jgi:cyclohexa-1,5-dienecarbonyl-CoA hydratase